MGQGLRERGGNGPTGGARAELRSRLEDRREEIEEALLTRVYGIAEPRAADPAYVEGLRAAVATALDYGLTTIERGEDRAPPVPATLLVQARIAARSGVSLDTVLRRYFAGYSLLGDHLIEVAGQSGLKDAALKRLLRGQAALFDRLLAIVSEEHRREIQVRPHTTQQRRAQLVRRLLEGELIDTAELAYELAGHHLGIVASGPGGQEAIQSLARSFDCHLLFVRPGEGAFWAWLGGRRRIDPELIERVAPTVLPPRTFLAIGEPGEEVSGWRFTHRQAAAALPVALHRSERFARYSKAALLASVLQDDLLATSLRQLYLEPLEGERDGGAGARETLRAYFAADRNISSAAVMLGLSRQGAGKRLRAIEERLGRPLASCGLELEAALWLDQADSAPDGDSDGGDPQPP
jgi:PucR C-terminal helix-turn-helix domain/GGDEF-like domain